MPHQCTDCSRRFDDGSKEMLSGCPNCGGNKFQYIPTSEIEADGTPGETSVDRSRTGSADSTVARTVGSAATAVRDLVGGSSGSEQSPTSRTATNADAAAKADITANADTKTATDAEAAADTNTAAETPDAGGTDTGTAEGMARTADIEARTDTSGEIEARAGTNEDAAQASARSELVSPDELPSVSEDRSGWGQTTPSSVQESRANGPENDPEVDSPGEQATERPDLSELREELNQQFESIKVVEPGQYELNLMELFDRQEYIIALQEDGKYTVQVPEHWQE